MTDPNIQYAPDWLEDTSEPDEREVSAQIDEYDLTSTPNDFNVLTINNFIESGAVRIPAFQRNYVWDIKRASRLIESLILGLPVPQIFLYEQVRNTFLVIDGQQRLMTIYYYIKQRFPKRERRAELRRMFDELGYIPESTLHDPEYFDEFRLRLSEISQGVPNKFNGLVYARLDDYRTQFDLRTIRNVIVKQVKPSDDNSSIFEMFNRLNTGGVLLSGQEIRASLYHSELMGTLARLNMKEEWRRLLGQQQPDLHMRDVELLLRSLAMAETGEQYNPSIVNFLNLYAGRTTQYDSEKVRSLERAFNRYFDATSRLPGDAFQSQQGRFMVTLFESVFAAYFVNQDDDLDTVSAASIERLRTDEQFQEHSGYRPTDRQNVRGRLRRAKELLVSS